MKRVGFSKQAMTLSLILLLSFAGGLVSAKSRTSEVKDSTSRSARLEDRFMTIAHLRVHYIDTGSGPTVVMIHGNAGSVEDFEFKAVPRLSSDYRVIAVDRPGHGSSDRPRTTTATLDYQAELLHQTLLNLAITKPILVGHSWGGSLALAYALKYPGEVSALVLIAPAAYPDPAGNGLVRMIVRTPLIGDLGLILTKVVAGRSMLRRSLAQAFYPQTTPDSYLKMVNSLWLGRKQLEAYIEDETGLNDSLRQISERYSEIDLPMVIVTGDQDRIVSPEENALALHAAIPQSRVLLISGAGHEIPQTHPESIVRAVRLVSLSLPS